MGRPIATTAILTIILTTGCQETPVHAGPVVEDSAGIRIVTNPYSPELPGRIPVVSSMPAVDIGSADGDSTQQLFGVTDVRRLPNDQIVVLDEGSKQIRFFDAQGRHARSVGTEGEGPGEYNALNGMALLGRDTILVFDNSLRRVTVLDHEGNLRGTVPVASTRDPVHPLRLYRLGRTVLADDLVLLPRAYPSDMRPTPTLHWDSVPNLRYTLAGELRDTVGEFSGMDIYATPRRAGNLHYGRYTSAYVADGALYITDGGAYAYRMYGADGPRSAIRLDRPPRELTSEDEAALEAYYMARARGAEGERRMAQYLAEWPRAEAKPWISDLVVDARGRVWVQEYEAWWFEGPRTWGVFGNDGAWLGEVELPGDLNVFEIGEDYVLGVWRDEIDVEHVRLYDLTG